MKFKFKNKKVVITGGSRGLGLALCEEFANEGADILLIARDIEELKRAKNSLQLKYPERSFFTVAADLCQPESYSLIREQIDRHFFSVDVLVNNAGAIMIGPFSSMTENDFRSQMEIHLFAALKMIQLCMPDFESQKEGQIINICSMGGKVAVPHMITYDASKFAMAGLSQGLAAELKSKNIYVTTVYPAVMMTGSPIQAIFKGNHAKSFDWFASIDYMPLLSLPADKAAKNIVQAAHLKKAELVMPGFANLRILGSALLPNLMISTMRKIHSFLPQEESQEYKSGFEVKHLARFLQKYLADKVDKVEERWNQKGKNHQKVMQNFSMQTIDLKKNADQINNFKELR